MMRHWLLAACALLSLATITGCNTYSLEELRHATPQGTAFQTALSKRYLQLSSDEEKGYDWANSWHFADKGLRSAYGKDVGPEDLNDWDIPAQALPDMQAARIRLVTALTPQVLQSQPEIAARAQSNFDCWVVHQEQRWQTNKIARCRDGLSDALDALSPTKAVAKDSGKASKAKKTVAAVKTHHTTKAVASRSTDTDKEFQSGTETYIVFFSAANETLTAPDETIIEQVLARLKTMEHYHIVLNGYADTAGDAIANLKLSQARAFAVKQRLVDGGAKAEAITLFGYGEPDATVDPAANSVGASNQRVEIFLNE